MKLSLLQSYLLAEQLVDRDELQRVEAERVARGLTLPHALFALEVLDGEALVGFLARRFKLPRIDAGDLTAVDVGDRLDPAFVLQRRVLPIAREGDMLTLVMSDPTDSETAEEVERRTRTTVMRAVALEPALDAALARHYGGVQGEATGELRELFGEGMKVETQPLQHEEVIPLTRRKAPAPPLTPQNTDHLENLVTAPLPRIDFNPGQEPPPLPAEFQEPPPLPDLDDPPPLPASALLAPTPPVDAGAASGRQRRSSKVKRRPSRSRPWRRVSWWTSSRSPARSPPRVERQTSPARSIRSCRPRSSTGSPNTPGLPRKCSSGPSIGWRSSRRVPCSFAPTAPGVSCTAGPPRDGACPLRPPFDSRWTNVRCSARS